MISVFDTGLGPVAQVLVGAMLVSSMETVWDGEITPCTSRSVYTRHYQDRALQFPRGAEMGRFNMGSTVVLLLPHGAVSDFKGMVAGDKVKLGQRIATLDL